MREFTSCFAYFMEDFISFKEAHGYSRKTYEDILADFDFFCVSQKVTNPELTKDLAMEWLQRRTEETLDRLSRRARVIRQLGKYLNSIGILAYSVPEGLFVSKSTFLPYIFTDSELSALFIGIDSIKPSYANPYKPLIAAVMFRLIYTCGLRPGEGLGLKRSHINLATGEIFIAETKGHQERLIVTSDSMLELCRKYERKRCSFSSSEYFFADAEGQPYKNAWLLKTLKHSWAKANPDMPKNELPNVRVYDLRHRFATAVLHRWLNDGRDLYAMLPYLRAYMGHKSFDETLYYLHLLPENLRKSKGIDWDGLESLIPEVSI